MKAEESEAMKTLATSPDASRTVRRTLAAVGAVAGICGLVALPPASGAQESKGLVTAGTQAGTQTVRGLVIGIDDYAPGIGKLQGAVNDARDIQQALAGMGVDDLTVLLDGAATRDRILAEWRGLLERAEPGDTLVLTYA